MKTLLERLKPEILKNLHNQQEDYKTLVGGLLKTLDEKVAVTEMTLGDLNDLSKFSNNYTVRILDLYDMFEDI